MKSYIVNKNVVRYEFGKPIETYSVIEKGVIESDIEFKYFQLNLGEEIKLKYNMGKQDIVYGLGENIRGINKRGWIYESFCTDDPNHAPDKKSLYGAHNFFIVDGEKRFGVYIDFPSKIIYDVGYEKKDKLEITIEGKDADIYIINGETVKEIAQNFLKIIGKGYVPPKWAFGYLQSRWSYPTEEAVESLANEFIERDIPCDGICLDLDYMDNYKDFSLSNERFPNFEEVTRRLKSKGVKIIPIIDAGVKIEDGYDIYEEGIEKVYFVTDKDGKPFVAAVWPG
ncbi:MAG: TIM-barrel domain-containing protein, partial [Clostridium paraputrificum]